MEHNYPKILVAIFVIVMPLIQQPNKKAELCLAVCVVFNGNNIKHI